MITKYYLYTVALIAFCIYLFVILLFIFIGLHVFSLFGEDFVLVCLQLPVFLFLRVPFGHLLVGILKCI